jgi:hypothetical protein
MNTSIKQIGCYTLGISTVICAYLVALHGWRNGSDSAERTCLSENARIHSDHRLLDAETSASPNAGYHRLGNDGSTMAFTPESNEQITPNTRAQHRSNVSARDNKSDANAISRIERHRLNKSLGGKQADAPHAEQPAPSNPIPFPASLVELPEGHPFTESQIKKMDELANQFVEDIGGTDQNPADPAYFDQWTESVPTNDSNYKFWFGRVAYVQQQLRAANAANAAQTTSTDSTTK